MNINTQKSYKNYNNFSRYTGVPIYFNSQDEKYFVGMTSWLNDQTESVIHTVVAGESLDSISLKYYGYPQFYWIIADFNRIIDPYKKLQVGQKLKIPEFSCIEFSY